MHGLFCFPRLDDKHCAICHVWVVSCVEFRGSKIWMRDRKRCVKGIQAFVCVYERESQLADLTLGRQKELRSSLKECRLLYVCINRLKHRETGADKRVRTASNMPGKPLLSILSPSKRSRASMDLQPAQLVSVDELLDNPWHYDCVVSPRLSVDSSASLRPIYPPSSSTSSSKTPILGNPTTPNLSQRRSQASPPRSFVSPPRSAAASVNHGRSAAPTTSNYVSLAVFLNNGATQGSSYGGFSPAENSNLGKPIITLVSKCRDRDQKSYIRGHPSRIRSYSGYLAVDS